MKRKRVQEQHGVAPGAGVLVVEVGVAAAQGWPAGTMNTAPRDV
jgi:hypothetical protein